MQGRLDRGEPGRDATTKKAALEARPFAVNHGWLAPLDLGDLVGLGAAGRVDLDGRAFLLADQRTRERRGDGDFALLGIGLDLADELPHLLLLGVLVDQSDGGAELDDIA